MLNEWTHSQIYSMVTNKYNKQHDSIIMNTLQNRGDNTIHAAAGKARKEIFKRTQDSFSLPAIKGRYYTLRKQGYKPTFDLQKKPKKSKLVTATSETITMNVRGVEITMVFK